MYICYNLQNSFVKCFFFNFMTLKTQSKIRIKKKNSEKVDTILLYSRCQVG